MTDDVMIPAGAWEALLRVFDESADAWERDQHPEKAARIRHFLQGVRDIAAEQGQLDTPGLPPRLQTWIAERAPELAAARPVTTIGPYWRRWSTLVAEFRLVRDADRTAGLERNAADWHPIVERAEAALWDIPAKQDDGQPLVLARRRLSPAERNDVIATRRGAVRSPDEMALRLLWLAARVTNAEEPLEDFRRQIRRYMPRPVPLTAPVPKAATPEPR